MDDLAYFFDKRDKQYIELNSQWSFYEMCQKKNHKLEQRIPQTILFDKGQAKLWLFNSQKAKNNEILKKNQDKLLTMELVKQLIQMQLPKEWKIEILAQYGELLKNNAQYKDKTPVAFVQLKRNEGIPLSRSELVQFFIDGKELSSVSYIQTYIHNNSFSSEVFYVEYRTDDDFLPPQFKFVKKTLSAKKQPRRLVKKQSNPFNPLLQTGQQMFPQVDVRVQHHNEIHQVQLAQTLFKFVDQTQNAKLAEEVKKIVHYIEQGFKVRVRKIIPKFVIDTQQVIYFVGIKQLLIDVPKKTQYTKGMRDELLSNGAFENFMMCCKQFKGQGQFDDSIHKMPKFLIEEDEKKLSKQLYRHLILEKCQGDFCKYKLLEKNKGPLQMRKGLLEQYKNVFKESKQTITNRSTNLPYKISFQLIIRARDNSQEVIQLFQRFKIHLEGVNPEEQSELPLDLQYPFTAKPTDVQTLLNLYRSVKICKNCFIIYSMISHNFEITLNKDLKKIRQTRTASPKNHRKAQTINQIEINRLSLGYLNYQKLDMFKTNLQLETDSYQQNELKLWHESPNGNLISMLAQVKALTTRRIDQNQNENKELLQKTEDLKEMISQTQKRDSDYRQMQQEYYQLKCQTQEPQLLITGSHYYYHINMDVVRKLYQYQLRTPMKALTDQLKYDELRQLNIEEVCKLQNYPAPCFEIPQLEYLIVDTQTAVPFAVFQGNMTIKREKKLESKLSQSGIEIILIMHDMFESFFEYYPILSDMINDLENKKIIVVNMPGQAYTLFSQEIVYNNVYICGIIDQLLYELTMANIINLQTDQFKIIGIGSGGFHAQAYVAQSLSNIPQFSQIMLINSFSQIYPQLMEFLQQSIHIFESQPASMPQLAFEYTNTMMNTQAYNEDTLNAILEQNPIQCVGRVAILNGLLQSPPFMERFQKSILSVSVYHSLKNCLINISEAESLYTFNQDDALDLNNLAINKKINQTKRIIKYLDGGHSALYDNRDGLIDIIVKFIG